MAEHAVQVEVDDLIPARPVPLSRSPQVIPQRPPGPRPDQVHVHRQACGPQHIQQRPGDRPVSHIGRSVRAGHHYQNVQCRPVFGQVELVAHRIDSAGKRQPDRQRRRQLRIPHRLPVQPVQPRRPRDLYTAPVERPVPQRKIPMASRTAEHVREQCLAIGGDLLDRLRLEVLVEKRVPQVLLEIPRQPRLARLVGLVGRVGDRDVVLGGIPEAHPDLERPVWVLAPLGQPDHSLRGYLVRGHERAPRSRTTTRRSPSAVVNSATSISGWPGREFRSLATSRVTIAVIAVLATFTATGMATSVKTSGRYFPRAEASTLARPTARACSSASHAAASSTGLTATPGSSTITKRPT